MSEADTLAEKLPEDTSSGELTGIGLEVVSIAKSYDKRAVLTDISLHVAKGEVLGLLGPNGAGKTTCFYSIMGLVRPDAGRILMDGEDVTNLPMYRRAILGLGYLPQETSIFRGMTVEQNINCVLEMVEPDPATREQELERLLDEFGLTQLRESPAMALSGGERRRCEIARALAAKPSIMLLDEPFAGIDPLSINDILEVIEMALGPRLDLRQTQGLVMTPQLQQAIKLLAASNLEIEAFVAEALEANPLLESGNMGSEESPDADWEDIPREEFTSDQLMAQAQGESEQPLDIDISALDRDHDTGEADWKQGDWGAAASASGDFGDMPDFENRSSTEISLGEHLHSQIGLVARDPKSEFIARHLIGLLDDAGYLRFDLQDTASDLGVEISEVTAALELVQKLEPHGVGARSLSECLAIQAREADRYDPCMARLIDNLEMVARGEFTRLKRMCGVDDEDFAEMLTELRSYDPKPGLAFGGTSSGAIVPDILISQSQSGGWNIVLNEETLPSLIVNREYSAEISGGRHDKATAAWLREKIADANWLIKALDQRQKTILKTASEIVKKQDSFFHHGVSGLKPLTLREVADAIEMHESTISRVTSNKYLHCERGTFELKYFFTSGVGSSDGEGASSETVKARIKALTDAEDPKKILSDDKLVELLKDEGFDLARRTVAKYREAIGIGSSVQRRRQKKLASL